MKPAKAVIAPNVQERRPETPLEALAARLRVPKPFLVGERLRQLHAAAAAHARSRHILQARGDQHVHPPDAHDAPPAAWKRRPLASRLVLPPHGRNDLVHAEIRGVSLGAPPGNHILHEPIRDHLASGRIKLFDVKSKQNLDVEGEG